MVKNPQLNLEEPLLPLATSFPSVYTCTQQILMPLGRSCTFTRVLPIRILLDTHSDREDPVQVQLLCLQPTYLSQENQALCLHTRVSKAVC